MTGPCTNLLHRRQFLLGPRAFTPTGDWQTFEVPGGLVLSAHPDLEITTCQAPNGFLLGIGSLIDPLRPAKSTKDVMQCVAAGRATAADVIAATTDIGGRWALLYVSRDESIIFNDPIGSRQVYYYTDDAIWCGSQPEIIRAATPLRPTDDALLLNFLHSPDFIEAESATFGEGTPYASCFHLLPNHYLDLSTAQPVRFFPDQPLPTLTVAEAIPTAAEVLRGTFDAMARRGPLMLPVTAGWDSRLLVAAARDHVRTMYCYVDRMGILGRRNPDVRVPERLAGRLGFDFTIEDSCEEPPIWFVELLRRNITGGRSLPKTRSIYAKWSRGETRVNVNGNGGEICRNYYGSARVRAESDAAPELLVERNFHHLPQAFAAREGKSWLSTLVNRMYNHDLLDLLYWEQRMGNWGTVYPAEQDVAVEEVSPYNNRLLITTMLSVPLEFRKAPKYSLFHELAEHLWPGVTSEPVNPHVLPPALRRVAKMPRDLARNSLPKPIYRKLRRLKQIVGQ